MFSYMIGVEEWCNYKKWLLVVVFLDKFIYGCLVFDGIGMSVI